MRAFSTNEPVGALPRAASSLFAGGLDREQFSGPDRVLEVASNHADPDGRGHGVGHIAGGGAVTGFQVSGHRALDGPDDPRDALQHLRPVHVPIGDAETERDARTGGGDGREPGLFEHDG